ncbi:Eco57I restriction-modification methylase domain-containing protein [Lysinibacillus xylanilyticus]|uniref:Eco57I restriction-modification methylase domain-containing protein n=1 Tax=Lysinibacillus xylanilyticus TaxID=582475 RepID=UPI003D0601A4
MKNRCQIFTPKQYVNKMLDCINYKGEKILGKYILENSCGEGDVLIQIVNRYLKAAKRQNYSIEKIKSDLEKYIIGFEIDNTVRETCINKLNVFIKSKGMEPIDWNIINADYLKYHLGISVDFIVGNPPYITYQDLKIEEREFLRDNFITCNKGKFDYCYAFIEKSIKDLNQHGKMIYIIPNSIFKNVFAQSLRDFMKKYLRAVYDYKESTVFKNALTSPAIIFLDKSENKNWIKYIDEDNASEVKIKKEYLVNKWLFSIEENCISNKIDIRFKDYFKVSNSVATLLNSIYVIKKADIIIENSNFVEIDGFKIEKEILRKAASPRSYAYGKEEYIIFPYKYLDGILIRFTEEEFTLNYPEATKYLKNYFVELSKRKSDDSASWFEYGRSQALLYLNQEKLMMSSVITDEIRCHLLDEKTIPYSGFYIIPIADKDLTYAREILNSSDFFNYISLRGINANGKSVRCSVKDILNYPIS